MALGCSITTAASAEPDRTLLPLAEPLRQVSAELDVRNATPPPRFEVKALDGAPNVLLILVDDLGFAGTSAFGGPVSTPSFDELAREGIIYNNFHTTATCSPTRAALLSSTAAFGKWHQTADVGIDLHTLVVEAIGAGHSSRFTGRIPRVTVEVKPSP